MARRVALLVRERQEEALRVAVGLGLADLEVEVCVLDRALARTPAAEAHLLALREAGARLTTTCAANADLELLSNAALARKILECDHIIPY